MKPTLYLHCGTEKTGSSFLQTMFVRNRDLLMSRGIHYPKSDKEFEMLEGKISPGNGIHLSDTLCDGETNTIKLMSNDLTEATNFGMNSVLYSSERLFNQFVEEGSIHKLQSAAKTAGFGDINALLYFRDPVSHALSMYKHRAKYGDHPDFDKWLQGKYKIFKLVEAFLEYSKATQIQWTCRKYKPDSAYMVNSAFVNWLETEAPDIPENDRINRSLNLNEIRVLQALKKEYPGSENFLRELLLSIQNEDKKSEKGLENKYSYLVAEKWRNHEALLDSLNTLMYEDEKLILQSVEKPCDDEHFVSLSEKQIQAVAEGMECYWNSQKMTHKIMRILKKAINKIRRKWASSRIKYNYLK